MWYIEWVDVSVDNGKSWTEACWLPKVQIGVDDYEDDY
jgi:hypothetical protein